MWIERDIQVFLAEIKALPVKVLKGPRQVGKTSVLEKLGGYRSIYFDDLSVRERARENPKHFLQQLPGPLILDEATLVPEIFLELKRRVDHERRIAERSLDIWVTGSNQTLLQRSVQESLAGRASYFDFNTLSLHELPKTPLAEYFMKGGWPELYVTPGLSQVRYLNDLVSTFIERDIVSAAGIERKGAFSRCLQLIAGRVGQLFNASDIAKSVSVDITTIQSWIRILEQNGVLRQVQSFSNNANNRLIKSPKYYFEDVALAVRLQGWSEYQPMQLSPAYGSLLENIACSEISRFFINRGESVQLYFIRSKEKVEIDFLIPLPNNKYLTAEVKSSAQKFSSAQVKLLESLKLNIVGRWIITPNENFEGNGYKVLPVTQIWEELARLCPADNTVL